GGRRRCAAARAQSGSRGPAAGGTAEKAGCEEEKTRHGSGPSGGTAAHGLGSAYARAHGGDACTCTCTCTCPRTLRPDGGGAVGDQLSLAVAIISVGGAIAGRRL